MEEEPPYVLPYRVMADLHCRTRDSHLGYGHPSFKMATVPISGTDICTSYGNPSLNMYNQNIQHSTIVAIGKTIRVRIPQCKWRVLDFSAFSSCLQVWMRRVCVILPSYLLCYCRESKSKEEYDGIDTDNLITLERLKQNQRQDYLKVGHCS